MGLFPDNEFFQCPSYTSSSLIIGFYTWFIILAVSMVMPSLVPQVSGLMGLVAFVWFFYNIARFFSPNPGCERVGYPGQHFANPFGTTGAQLRADEAAIKANQGRT
jgi:hypothetical protein